MLKSIWSETGFWKPLAKAVMLETAGGVAVETMLGYTGLVAVGELFNWNWARDEPVADNAL